MWRSFRRGQGRGPAEAFRAVSGVGTGKTHLEKSRPRAAASSTHRNQLLGLAYPSAPYGKD